MREDARRAESAALAQRYSEDAVSYRRLWAPQLRRLGSQLLAALPLQDARRVLDVGCGVGALFADIEAAAPEAAIFGSDLSPGMLRLADPRFGRVVMDATELGFASGSFDVVTMCFMLFHVPDPAAALNEAKRVLRPGGSLGVITWRGESTYPALEVWTEALDRHGAAPSEQIATRHELVDSPAKLESLLGDTGFVDLRSWTADLNEVLDLESFIEARTRLGRCKRRFESLDVATRQSCLRHARLRLEALGSDDFVDRSTAIFVTATKSST